MNRALFRMHKFETIVVGYEVTAGKQLIGIVCTRHVHARPFYLVWSLRPAEESTDALPVQQSEGWPLIAEYRCRTVWRCRVLVPIPALVKDEAWSRKRSTLVKQ